MHVGIEMNTKYITCVHVKSSYYETPCVICIHNSIERKDRYAMETIVAEV